MNPAREPSPKSPKAPLPSANFASASFPQEEILDLMDRLPSNIALIDEAGDILAVNAAWRSFAAANSGDSAKTGTGANYLATCDAAARTGDMEAGRFAEGLRAVICGERSTFELETACVLGSESLIVCGRVTRLADPLARYVMVSHEVSSAARAA